jgi:hypothetical protein
VPDSNRFYKPLHELTSLGRVALTVFVGQVVSEFVVPSTVAEFRFFALFGTIVGLGGANLLNVSRRVLLILLAGCLLIGWAATAGFHILIGTGAEAGVGLYLTLSFLLVLAFASVGAALRMAGLTSETSANSNEEGSGQPE